MSNNFLGTSPLLQIRPLDQMIDGMYSLGAVVRRSAAGAVYETGFGDDARPAVIKIRFVESPAAERLVAQWRNAIELSHPNLLRVYAAGFSKLDRVPMVYVVMERADVSLAGVLSERALSEAETREILAPTLAALRYLHENGYTHGGLKPSDILAAGDEVKLSADNALAMEDGANPADDMRALGTVIVQGLTQEVQPGLRTLPDASETIRDIVRHCLEPDPKKRWTVEQVQARLEGRVAAPLPPARVEEIRPVVEIRRDEDREEAIPQRRTPKWIFAALAALILMVIVAGYMRRKDPNTGAVAPVPAAERPAPAASWPGAEVKDPSTPAKPSPAGRVNAAVTASRGRRGEGWAAVVATYGSRDAADKRQHELAHKWPKFTFTVFQQPSEKAQFLIVIGQHLSEDQADALRKRAVAAGIPADTYIKKFQ